MATLSQKLYGRKVKIAIKMSVAVNQSWRDFDRKAANPKLENELLYSLPQKVDLDNEERNVEVVKK